MGTVSTKCHCCDHQIEVKTIYDMLDYAYRVIDSNPQILKFFSILGVDKTTIGICQNNTRLFSIAEPFKNFSPRYRAIQSTESGIYLCFNETMYEIEAIEVKPYLFRDDALRGWGTRFKDLDDKEKITLFESAFIQFGSNLAGLSDYIEYRNMGDRLRNEIALNEDNERLKGDYACAYFPDGALEYPYFEFDIDHKEKNGHLDKITFIFNDREPVDCPISLWLHQYVVNMYPDFGNVYLWFNSGAGDINSLEEYDFSQTDLPESLEDWSRLFNKMDDDPNPDWETFNNIGKSLHSELQNIVKERYIIVYGKSFEETNGNYAERKKLEESGQGGDTLST